MKATAPDTEPIITCRWACTLETLAFAVFGVDRPSADVDKKWQLQDQTITSWNWFRFITIADWFRKLSLTFANFLVLKAHGCFFQMSCFWFLVLFPLSLLAVVIIIWLWGFTTLSRKVLSKINVPSINRISMRGWLRARAISFSEVTYP